MIKRFRNRHRLCLCTLLRLLRAVALLVDAVGLDLRHHVLVLTRIVRTWNAGGEGVRPVSDGGQAKQERIAPCVREGVIMQ